MERRRDQRERCARHICNGRRVRGKENKKRLARTLKRKESELVALFLKAPHFLLPLRSPGLLPNEAEAWGWRKRCRGCHVTKAFLFPTLLLAMKMMQGFAFEAGWQNMTRTGWKTRLILRGVERVATSKRHSIQKLPAHPPHVASACSSALQDLCLARYQNT